MKLQLICRFEIFFIDVPYSEVYCIKCWHKECTLYTETQAHR